MRWIWIRHGETDLNAKGCYLGHFDEPLNEKGKHQALQVAEELISKLDTTILNPVTKEKYDVDSDTSTKLPFLIYSSDLSRCMETAQIIWKTLSVYLPPKQKLVSPIPSQSLRELDFGEWDCKTYTEILQMDSIGLKRWYQDPFSVAPPDGETLSDLGNRLDTDTLLTTTFQTILVISHGGPIRWFMSTKVEKDSSRFWEVNHISHGGMYMVDWNAQSWKESRS